MADPSEVTLLRSGSPKSREQDADRSTPRRVRKPAAVADDAAPKKGAVETPPPGPDDRIRHITALLIEICAVLLLLALLSYTAQDQANADVGVRDLFGLMTNDPVVAARADTTENWLGLLGAFISNFLINGTVGYMSLAIPFLIAVWGAGVYRGGDYSKQTRLSSYAAILMTLVASVFGTVQLVAWMPHPSHEWSGSVGAFIATLLSGLLGTAGSSLILLAAIAIAVIYAFDLDVREIVSRARAIIDQAGAHAANARRVIAEKTIAPHPESDPATEPAATNDPAPADARRAAARATAQPLDASLENEPARMMRRMRNVDDDPVRATPDPKIRRPEPPPLPMFETSPPPPPVRETPLRQEELRQEGSRQNESRRSDSVEPPLRPIERPASEPAPFDEEAPRFGEVTVKHNELAPQSADAQRPAAKLTLNVRDVESDADVETEHRGALIERVRNEQIKYVPPPIDLLVPQGEQAEINDDELKENGRILQEKLATFDIEIEDLQVTPGPVVTLYEFVPAPGIKISRIESLADDIALALKARGIRIIAPIPGKGTVGVEIPNHKPAMVRIRSVLNTAKFRENSFRLPLALGKTTVGEVFVDDLAKMPHLLIAGATGSGKSVGVNAILTSLLYKMHPSDLKLVIIDPKKIEMTQYKMLKDHFLARCPDIDEDIITQPQNAVLALKSIEMEMDRRYDILAKVGQRNIFDYNLKVSEGKYADHTDFDHIKLPYIVVILDELADLMMTAGREIEEPIARLAQLARAIGIHLIVATQRPSVNVITGVIKANFPARIAYQVASKIDSRTILDMNGAEYLLGNGDMLYLPGGMPKPMRLQNAFISTEEVEEICEHIGRQVGYTTPYELPSVLEKTRKSSATPGGDRDDLFEEAARLVVQHQQGSVSLVQRRLKVGYSRAARIIDELEMAGVVGPFDGSKARAVLLESEAELEAFL
jgi:S-DNA-T family DNA segregation ATPase FtsK/SpoIIIE